VTIDQQIRKRRRRGGKGNVMHLPKGVSENSKISRDLCNQSKSSDYEFDEDLVLPRPDEVGGDHACK
jgi:hypothetical protein